MIWSQKNNAAVIGHAVLVTFCIVLSCTAVTVRSQFSVHYGSGGRGADEGSGDKVLTHENVQVGTLSDKLMPGKFFHIQKWRPFFFSQAHNRK